MTFYVKDDCEVSKNKQKKKKKKEEEIPEK